MPIKTSSARQVDALVADLRGDDAVRRDAAVARLTVIGARAVERLAAVARAATETAPARLAAFRALEGIDDPRALTTAIGALATARQDPSIGVAAVAVARAFLNGGHGVAALDALTAAAKVHEYLLSAEAAADFEAAGFTRLPAAHGATGK